MISSHAQNIWNATWSTVQSLTRTTPEHFATLPPDIRESAIDLIREVVHVGFVSGLLKEGGTSWPSGGKLSGEDEVVETCWKVRRCPAENARRSACCIAMISQAQTS